MKRPTKDDPRSNAAMDISGVLRGWTFQPGQVNVRLIRGSDGKPKLQLRLDLGLLQMELNGRPDGKKPHKAPTETGVFIAANWSGAHEKIRHRCGVPSDGAGLPVAA